MVTVPTGGCSGVGEAVVCGTVVAGVVAVVAGVVGGAVVAGVAGVVTGVVGLEGAVQPPRNTTARITRMAVIYQVLKAGVLMEMTLRAGSPPGR